MTGTKPKIFVLYYSTYGHVHTVAQAITKGLLKSNTVDAELYQIPETLPADVLEKMHAAPKSPVPVITPEKLAEADGFLLGFPTRFGVAPAQVKAFFDATGQLWSQGAFVGKPAGLFFSTGSQHGGQESTAFSFLSHFAHHGIIFVPLGYASPLMFDNESVMGGSAWGSGTVAGPDGSLQPTQKELEIAETQGENFAKVAVKLSGVADSAGAAPVAAAAAAAAPAPVSAPAAEKPAA
ncbi:flavodoxin-like fold protein, partial [Coemansia sp. RSA 2703]